MLTVLFQIGIGFGGFQSMLQNMQSLGFFQFLFPFLLALAIFYGVMKWGVGDRLPNSAVGLISLILSFFVMLFASANPGIVQFFQTLSGTGLIVATGFLFLIILLGILGFKAESIFSDREYLKYLLPGIIVLIFIVLFFGAGAGFFVPGLTVSSDWMTIIFFIVILAIVMSFLNKSGGEAKGAGGGGGGGGGGHSK